MKEIILAITNKDYSVIVKIYYQVIKFCLMVRDLSNMLKGLRWFNRKNKIKLRSTTN
jgi:hypothetical protein